MTPDHPSDQNSETKESPRRESNMDRIQMREEVTKKALEDMKIEEPGWLEEIRRKTLETSAEPADSNHEED